MTVGTAHFPCGSVIVARQEHGSLSAMHGRLLAEGSGAEMVEALAADAPLFAGLPRSNDRPGGPPARHAVLTRHVGD